VQFKTKGPFGRYPPWREKPYGVRVEFEVAGEYFVDEEETIPSFVGIRDEACVLLSDTHVFHFERDESASKHEEANIWNAYIEGFETTAEAEKAGEWFATALMFNSVMYAPYVKIRYSLPDPYEVYSRRLPKKQSIRTFLSLKDADLYKKHTKVVNTLRKAWLSTEGSNISERLFLALELYTTAQFENSDRAKFIGVVSAIEPLATQEDYSQKESYEIAAALEELCKEVDTYTAIPDPIRASMKGQIRNLRRESVRRACRRLINDRLPEHDDATNIFEQAYSARSKMLHEGETPTDLERIYHEMQNLVRNLLLTFLPS